MVVLHQLQLLALPFLAPVCAVLAWLLMLAGSWSLWRSLRGGWAMSKRLHQIPCSHCRFFTGNYLLKCTVHPDTALSEAAIQCRDYRTQSQVLDV